MGGSSAEPDAISMCRGQHIGFLGMDGIGKSTMVRMLIAKLEASGIPVENVSWRAETRAHAESAARSLLRELWVESWRLLFLGSEEAAAAPTTYEQFEREAWEDRLVSVTVDENPPAAPLAAAWLDLCGQTIVQHQVIEPLRAAGTTVVEESYGLKLVLKELLTARALANTEQLRAEVAFALSILPRLFQHRTPDLGIVLSGSVDMAYRWRISQTGSTGSMEDMGTAGQKGYDGFETLQRECDRRFRELVSDGGWQLFEMEEVAPEENFARLLDVIRPHLGRLESSS